ncbi:hypothetical protein BKN38_05305 [Helicobacter sp. CLO-3]|uniref:tyrosine-type recombinase/integrase n=1 Tax=unclassified Helicobacter TaxID=2593540 RepID=UPI000805BB50|nr:MULTISPECIES: site-specific integrase [unclassified Helicobacter]OBV30134.1 hypothetical protein BA723_02500 [Helicobacter sp. CLO-3]OHU83522.1 hypothetical protein BKN38_05305 [Helicobacter sp. CLO-3]
MSRIAKQILFDKDIRALEPKKQKYRVVVGNPSELILWVYPSGVKSFALRIRNNDREKNILLKQFRQGIYSAAEARKEAIEKLKIIENGGELNTDKYLFKNLYKSYITQKHKKGQAQSTIKSAQSLCENHLLPHFGNLDAKQIKYSNILHAFNGIFDENNPKSPKLETIKRAKIALRGILAPAIKDRYIEYDPTIGLEKEFPSIRRYCIENDIDTRLAALVKEDDLREFLSDLSVASNMDIQVKRAIYLQILCINRPANTAGAKWKHIDLDTAIWRIPAKEMKMRESVSIAINSYALQILKKQKEEYGILNSEFVFPRLNKKGHIHRDSLSKALRHLANGKWCSKVTTHGFRSTFRTICSTNETTLLKLGIGNNAIEVALAHKTTNAIQYAYEREKSTIEQQAILMQWYGDYLNNLCKFKI